MKNCTKLLMVSILSVALFPVYMNAAFHVNAASFSMNAAFHSQWSDELPAAKKELALRVKEVEVLAVQVDSVKDNEAVVALKKELQKAQMKEQRAIDRVNLAYRDAAALASAMRSGVRLIGGVGKF